MKPSRIALAMVVAGLVGLSIFASLAYRAVNIRTALPSEAVTRFEAVRQRFLNGAASAVSEVKLLEVLAYRASEQRLVEAHVPFWFLRMKGPALEFALRDTGLDLNRLGLTADDLARRGPGLVLDQTQANGDRLLVWTE